MTLSDRDLQELLVLNGKPAVVRLPYQRPPRSAPSRIRMASEPRRAPDGIRNAIRRLSGQVLRAAGWVLGFLWMAEAGGRQP